jgi:hypothetical protein
VLHRNPKVGTLVDSLLDLRNILHTLGELVLLMMIPRNELLVCLVRPSQVMSGRHGKVVAPVMVALVRLPTIVGLRVKVYVVERHRLGLLMRRCSVQLGVIEQGVR